HRDHGNLAAVAGSNRTRHTDNIRQEQNVQSNNPVLQRQPVQETVAGGERMTLNGTVSKTGLLLVLAVVTGAWTWHRFATAFAEALKQVGAGVEQPMAVAASQAMGAVTPFLWGGLIVGFILAMVSVFKP